MPVPKVTSRASLASARRAALHLTAQGRGGVVVDRYRAAEAIAKHRLQREVGDGGDIGRGGHDTPVVDDPGASHAERDHRLSNLLFHPAHHVADRIDDAGHGVGAVTAPEGDPSGGIGPEHLGPYVGPADVEAGKAPGSHRGVSGAGGQWLIRNGVASRLPRVAGLTRAAAPVRH